MSKQCPYCRKVFHATKHRSANIKLNQHIDDVNSCRLAHERREAIRFIEKYAGPSSRLVPEDFKVSSTVESDSSSCTSCDDTFKDVEKATSFEQCQSWSLLMTESREALYVDISSDHISVATSDPYVIELRFNAIVDWPKQSYTSARAAVFGALKSIFESESTLIVLYDLRDAARTIWSLARVKLVYCIDVQLVMEDRFSTYDMTFAETLGSLGISSSNNLKKHEVDVSLLLEVFNKVHFDGGGKDLIVRASEMRASMYRSLSMQNDMIRWLVLDKTKGYRLMSQELLTVIAPENIAPVRLPQPDQNVDAILKILPPDLRLELRNLDESKPVVDICLDIQRRPTIWRLEPPAIYLDIIASGESCHVKLRVLSDRTSRRDYLSSDESRLVRLNDIDTVVGMVGGFGSDNRAGLQGELHRISAIHNRDNPPRVIGLTIRVGRHIPGNADMIRDILFQDPTKSILVLGEPGSGKTSVIRDITRLLAEERNVFVVDTSNEIAGDGDLPHSSIGRARRLQVPSLNKQMNTMIECVQNHTPDVMVIDEIGRPAEVEAAQTCKQRGVRMIASAHGDVRKLLKNQQLNFLIGGITSVIVGDRDAKVVINTAGDSHKQKIQYQRKGAPIFDMIVELSRGKVDAWYVVQNAAVAVDAIIGNKHYQRERRVRNASTGAFSIDIVNA